MNDQKYCSNDLSYEMVLHQGRHEGREGLPSLPFFFFFSSATKLKWRREKLKNKESKDELERIRRRRREGGGPSSAEEAQGPQAGKVRVSFRGSSFCHSSPETVNLHDAFDMLVTCAWGGLGGARVPRGADLFCLLPLGRPGPCLPAFPCLIAAQCPAR